MDRSWSGFVVVAIALPGMAVAASRPAPNAFLDSPVSDTGQLVKEVQTDSAVRDRYMRHFGMSAGELNAYLWSLRVSRMPDPEVVSVYSVPNSGAVKVHEQRLNKGERVFVDASDKPTLLVSCGNPLTLGPSNRLNASIMSPSIEGTSVFDAQVIPSPEANSVLLIEPRPMIAMAEPPDTIADIITQPETTTSVLVAPPPTPSTDVVVPPPPPIIVPGGGGPNGFFLLPLLAGGALIGIISSHHGSNSNPIVPVTPIVPVIPIVPPLPTPEPVGVVFLAAGAAALLVRRNRLQ